MMKESFLKSLELPCKEDKLGSSLLRVAGFQPFSLIDYPHHLSAIIFCQGCSWRCRYCHNLQLQSFVSQGVYMVDWGKVLEFLKRRRTLLDGVVFSGGEPILQPNLIEAIGEVRKLGFKIGLHSGGSSVRRFALVLPHVDWVGLDVKAPPSKYARITQVKGSGIHPWECVRLLIKSGVSYECRTTLHPLLHTEEDVWDIAQALQINENLTWV